MRNASFGECIIAVLLGCYLMICFSPLRLEYDSIQYFAVKDCLEHSCPPGFVAATDPHPYGYPLVLWLLSRMGLLHPFAITFLNLLFLVGALYFVVRLFKERTNGRKLEWGVILLLLGYPFVKIFSYPLSEMQYLFFSCGSLYFFHLYTARGQRVGALLMAFIFAGLAILTRTVGLVLLPAMLLGLGWHHRSLWRRRKWMLLPALAILAGGLFFLRGYSGLYMKSVQRTGPGWSVLLKEHFMEWGQLWWNAPVGKIAPMQPVVVPWLFVLTGVLFVMAVCYCLGRWRKQVPIAVSAYLVIYCLMIFCWPFFDVRFWMPVFPFVVIILLNVTFFNRELLRIMVAVYILAGAGAIGYSIYTSFNKQVLARTQAGGRYRNEYETFFFGKPMSDTATQMNPYVLHIIETCK